MSKKATLGPRKQTCTEIEGTRQNSDSKVSYVSGQNTGKSTSSDFEVLQETENM